MKNFRKRPENGIAFFVILFHTRLNDEMRVVGHDAGSDQSITAVAPMKDAVKNNVARDGRKFSRLNRVDNYVVNRPRFLEVRQIPF